MNYQAAQQYLASNPHASLVWRALDATLTHYHDEPVWLDEDGVLVQSHPTDTRRGPISAPQDATFEVRATTTTIQRRICETFSLRFAASATAKINVLGRGGASLLVDTSMNEISEGRTYSWHEALAISKRYPVELFDANGNFFESLPLIHS